MRKRTYIQPQAKDEIRKRYIAGEPASKIANTLSLSVFTVRRIVERYKLGEARNNTLVKANEIIQEDLAKFRAQTTLEVVDPLVSKLVQLAGGVLNKNEEELSGKDILNSLEAFLRLRAKLKGEVLHKSEVDLGVRGLWMQLVRQEPVVEKVVEYEWI